MSDKSRTGENEGLECLPLPPTMTIVSRWLRVSGWFCLCVRFPVARKITHVEECQL